MAVTLEQPSTEYGTAAAITHSDHGSSNLRLSSTLSGSSKGRGFSRGITVKDMRYLGFHNHFSASATQVATTADGAPTQPAGSGVAGTITATATANRAKGRTANITHGAAAASPHRDTDEGGRYHWH
jgi:hypothetical protein